LTFSHFPSQVKGAAERQSALIFRVAERQKAFADATMVAAEAAAAVATMVAVAKSLSRRAAPVTRAPCRGVSVQ